jgi:hypothetical protein
MSGCSGGAGSAACTDAAKVQAIDKGIALKRRRFFMPEFFFPLIVNCK